MYIFKTHKKRSIFFFDNQIKLTTPWKSGEAFLKF